MKDSLELTIKSSIFDRNRKLVINSEFLDFESSDLINSQSTRLFKAEIGQMRFGIKWIRGYQFIIGRIYCIDVKTSTHKAITIRLKSLYGVNRRALAEKYGQIVNALYDFYFDDISRAYLNKFSNGEPFEILGICFRKEGVEITKKHMFITWNDLGTKSYHTHYSLYSNHNPLLHVSFYYLDDWNTGILYSVSREILRDKGFWKE